MKLVHSFIFLSFLCLSAGCEREEAYHYPDVLTDLVEIETDAKSNIKLLRTDDGAEYALSRAIELQKSTPDSLYRMRCTFQIREDGKCTLYATNQVLAPFPVTPEEFKKEIRQDPVKITSSWRSGGYVNLHLGLLAKEDKHAFRFIYKGIRKNTAGTDTHLFLFHHDKGTDTEAYTREVFLSCPLKKLNISENDSVCMSINTYDGIKEIKL